MIVLRYLAAAIMWPIIWVGDRVGHVEPRITWTVLAEWARDEL